MITVNGREYEWGDIQIATLGRIINATGIDFSKKANNSVIYARGREPHSHQRAGKSYPVTLKILQSEAHAWEDAVAPRDVVDVPISITLCYAPVEGGRITTVKFYSFLPSDEAFSHATNTPNGGVTVTGECLKIV